MRGDGLMQRGRQQGLEQRVHEECIAFLINIMTIITILQFVI